MAIQVSCAACQAEFKAKDEHAGKSGRCPRCKAAVTVPTAARLQAVVEAPAGPAETDEYSLADAPGKPRATLLRASKEDGGVATAALKAVANTGPTRTPAEILAAFRGDIEPVRPTLLYRIWIAIVAGVMLLLPLIYVAIIGLVGYGVYYHAVHHVGVLRHVRNAKAAFLIYLSPMAVGVMVIGFMLKPLFARPGRSASPKALDPSKEPLVFAFVDGVCSAVGAPRPIRVEVDCNVNASARFDAGPLAWLRGDLVLTIGLPLVAGLTLRQFAGVLAHEFGHFSQRVGMRLTSLIWSVNLWFARVVYERDEWDESLKEWSSSDNGAVVVFALLAQLAVWLTRRILWVLMMVGHLVSGFLSRQMEFDADRYEARMVGSDTFEQTSRRLVELNLAQQGAFQDLAASWRERRLPDNFPRLILANVAQIPDEVRRSVLKAAAEARTGLFDTHPADKARIARARAEAAEGIFQLGGPATDLLRDFDSLALSGSLAHYRALVGEKVTRDQLYAVATAVEDAVVMQQGNEALGRFFLESVANHQRLPLPPDLPGAADDLKEGKRSLVAARAAMQKARESYREAQAAWDDREAEWTLALTAATLLRAGDRVKAAQFGLEEGTTEAAEYACRKAEAACQRLAEASRPFDAAATNRLRSALGLLESDAVAARVPDGQARREEARHLYPCAAHLAVRVVPELEAAMRVQRVMVSLLEKAQQGNNEKRKPFVNACLRAGRQLQESLLGLQRSLGNAIPYPFEHANQNIGLGQYALQDVPHYEALGDLYVAAEQASARIMPLYYRVLGRLAVTAEEVERIVGLGPIEVPAPAESGPILTA